jgi:hypothetical protein
VPLPQETTFGYRAAGAQLFLYPAALGQRAVALDVLHAGGYGLASATAAQQAAQFGKQPVKPEDQFDQKIWKSHWQQRQALGASVAGDATVPSWAVAPDAWPVAGPKADASAYQQSYTALQQDLDLIRESCADRKRLGYRAKSFVTKVGNDGLSSQLAELVGSVLVALRAGDARCYNEATSACLRNDHTQVVPALQWWGQLILDGGTYLVDSGALESCLTFDFEWDTLVLHSNPAPEGYLISASHRVDTKTRVHFHVSGAQMPLGTAPAAPNNYMDAKWLGGAPQTCTIVATGKRDPDLFTVQSMTLTGNAYEDNPPPPLVDVVYGTGNPQVELNETCSGQPHLQYFPMLAPAYSVLHFLEDPVLVSPWHPHQLFVYEPVPESWTVRHGALWATRGYDGSLNIGTIHSQESTQLNLFHRPGQL